VPGGLIKLKTKQIIKSFDSRGGHSSNQSAQVVAIYGGGAAAVGTGSGSGGPGKG